MPALVTGTRVSRVSVERMFGVLVEHYPGSTHWQSIFVDAAGLRQRVGVVTRTLLGQKLRLAKIVESAQVGYLTQVGYIATPFVARMTDAQKAAALAWLAEYRAARAAAQAALDAQRAEQQRLYQQQQRDRRIAYERSQMDVIHDNALRDARIFDATCRDAAAIARLSSPEIDRAHTELLSMMVEHREAETFGLGCCCFMCDPAAHAAVAAA